VNDVGSTRRDSAPSSVLRGLFRAVLRKGAVSLPVGAALALAPLYGTPSFSKLALPYLPRTPHQAYGYELAQRGFMRTPSAFAWVTAAEAAAVSPDDVELPYTAAGDLGAEANAALGIKFTVAAGRRLELEAALQTAVGERAFVDVYRVAGGRLERVGGALPGATATGSLSFEVLDPTDFVVRLQPEAAAAARYSVAVAERPLLTFPVTGLDTRAIQSGFGAERDGGTRAHRGVDIFAKRGHPVVAATDGWIVRVEETPVGGKVVWQQPLFGGVRLYYAHLDEQLVERGQFVRAGDPVGKVGNTGNAVTTPPHLHFGVYLRRTAGRGGAVDPYPLLD
jgi:murein DD-endopeptidase MepM/ murein hydrolase activator NlpD